MKIYFLYNKNGLTISNDLIEGIVDSICTILKIEKKQLEKFSHTNSDDIPSFAYQCIIDEKGIISILDKKSLIQDKIDNFLKLKTGKIFRGSVRLETNFDDNAFKNHSKAGNLSSENEENAEFDYKRRAKTFVPSEPSYTFDRVILPDSVKAKIEEAINLIVYEKKVFDEWGLRAIQPNPCSAMSFFGPSGTGKTMAAEAIANKLGKKILKVSYADIESKYHGEGPKMVKAIFLAAEENDAILFIDEADSLLSKRLTNVSQGSEQAINSMRSQLLICLEAFHGIAIFATNLVVNYDKAFLTRLISIEFKKPNADEREKIWNVHIKPINGNSLNIPLSDDIDTKKLAQDFDFSGREIRKAVISACIKAAMNNQIKVCQIDFIEACNKIKLEEETLKSQQIN